MMPVMALALAPVAATLWSDCMACAADILPMPSRLFACARVGSFNLRLNSTVLFGGWMDWLFHCFRAEASVSVRSLEDLNVTDTKPFSNCFHSLPWVRSSPFGFRPSLKDASSLIGPLSASNGLPPASYQRAISHGRLASNEARLVSPSCAPNCCA